MMIRHTLAIALTLPLLLSANGAAKTQVEDPPRVQLALLLDNSGSMSGLLQQAREELWTIVNALDGATRNGEPVKIEVALYSYGDDPAQLLVPFTGDLDRISEALFSLGIAGGDEFCGAVIDKAARKLAWSPTRNDLKLVFIAGNEPFSQGPVRYRDAIKRAGDPGIVVSTIHCGTDDAEAREWQQAATLSGGAFANIDHNAAVAHIDTPFDREIAELGGAAINSTYIPYGADGKIGSSRQQAQDSNALGSSLSSGTGRGLSKSSANYNNADWDLVDAVRDGRVNLDKADKSTLPENMRNMTADERRAFVASIQAKRDAIKARIAALNIERQAYIAAQPKPASASSSFDSAILAALTKLAADKGFVLKGAH
jgi:hypothetical protein